MKTFPISRNELLKDISTFGASEMTGTAEPTKKTNKGFVQKYCINKKEQVKKKNKKELLVGRDTEIKSPKFFAVSANKMY
jgi:predicted house-cleaning NTP pyrophosphatase (Maf/HAM1 superfamily)